VWNSSYIDRFIDLKMGSGSINCFRIFDKNLSVKLTRIFYNTTSE